MENKVLINNSSIDCSKIIDWRYNNNKTYLFVDGRIEMRENSRIDMPELGARIRQARTDKNMSQLELAEVCGISVPYVSDVERGKKCFSVDILLRVAQALEVSTDWLLRLDIPQTQYAYSAEAAELMAACSRDEATLLLDLMRSAKEIIIKRR